MTEEKQKRLEDAFVALTDALGAYGCEFVCFDIDCSRRNADELAKVLRLECACDNVVWGAVKETGRYKISCTTQTGADDKDDPERKE